ncbi:MAG TPA: GNAT family N-acetyltransferase [Actinomycetota bacterium]
MTLPGSVVRFWRALDALFSDVQSTWWGAVVTDGRFPRIWDANYARVDLPVEDLGADDVLDALTPAARAAGADLLHVVAFHPERHTRLLAELSTRGHRLAWDVVLGTARRIDEPDVPVEELRDDEELWGAVTESFALFGVEPGEAVSQLQTIEREVLAPGGKRWFGVRDGSGRLVSLGALHQLVGVGYVDNVSTVPGARGRGYAAAVTARIVREALAAGATEVFLLADPDDGAVLRLYGRLGFRELGRLASTKGVAAPG